MATLTYPNGAVAGLARPDVAAVRFIEFTVDFSKVSAVATDDVVVGLIPKGSVVIAGAATVVTPAAAAATYTLRVGSTAVSAALTGNSAAGTIAANAVTGAIVTTAEQTVNVLVGAQPATGKAHFVLVVTEAIKPNMPSLSARDQSVA